MLDAMLAAIAHRGPDGEGTWRGGGAVALGHVRLSIIDLSTAANQPMLSPDGRYVISFNGEIYNFKALRAELEQAGVRFRTRSDTEVLLEMFQRYGGACLDRLSGIFAFAVWDNAERRLFLARDPLGVKPLYYASLPSGFLFASELKALVACPDLPRGLDAAAVANHVGFVWSSSDATMLKSVRKLRPGHFAWVSVPGAVRLRRYYEPPVPEPAGRRTKAEAADLLALFDGVVADQMVADVPVGACLSGGVDSSAVVAAMCRAADPARIVTLCATVAKDKSSTDNFGDDVVYARQMARSVGVPLVEVPTDADLAGEFPGMLWQLDEPTADFAAVQTRLLAAEAKRQGIKVLLAGIGGDDLFTGYGRHRAAQIWSMLEHLPGGRALAARFIRGWPSTSLIGRGLARLGDLLSLGEEEMLTEAMSFATTGPATRLSLLSPHLRGEIACSPFAHVLERTRGLDPVERLLHLDLDGFLPDLNLNYADKMAMRSGVEMRVPILDTRLVASAMTIPVAQKIDLFETKKIFRRAVGSRLPRGILRRAKQGFGAPVRAWLSGAGRALLDELTAAPVLLRRGLFEPAAVAALRAEFDCRRGDVAFTLLSLMAVESWCRGLDEHPALARNLAFADA